MVYCTSLLCVCVYTVMCLCVSMCLCVFHGMHVDTRGQLEVYQSSYFNMHVTESIVARHCGHQYSRPMSFRDFLHMIAEIIDAHGHTQGSEDLNSGPHAYTANMLPTESSPQTPFYMVSQNIFKSRTYTFAVHFSPTWERASQLQHAHHRRDKDNPCYLLKNSYTRLLGDRAQIIIP